jgi:hypothetical protein
VTAITNAGQDVLARNPQQSRAWYVVSAESTPGVARKKKAAHGTTTASARLLNLLSNRGLGSKDR